MFVLRWRAVSHTQLSRWLVCLLAISLLPSAAAAEVLTLQGAIARALSANPDLRAVAAAEAEARERRLAARAGWFPRVDVHEGWQRGDQPVFVFGSLLNQRRFSEANFTIASLNHPDPLDNFRSAVSVSQPVFDGGGTAAVSASATASQSLASVARREASADVAVAVAEAYAQILSAEAGVRAAAAAVDAASEDTGRARARRDAGMATDADVLSLEVHLAQMRARQIAVSSEVQIARARLNRLMGVSLDESWDFEQPMPRTSVGPDAGAAETAAVRDSPRVAAAALRVDLAHANAAAARAGLLPHIGIEGGYEWNGGTWSDRPSSWLFGVRGQWSLNAAGGERRVWNAAQRAAERARAEQQAAETAARLAVRTALARLEAARARATVATATAAQARESERIIRDRYDSGLTTVTDVLRAANASLDAAALETTARVDVVVAGVTLDRAVGRVPDGTP